jgi:hypothetical protein
MRLETGYFQEDDWNTTVTRPKQELDLLGIQGLRIRRIHKEEIVKTRKTT